MKICDVKAVHPEAPGAPADWRSSLGQIAVSVRADDGTVGIGVGGGGAAGVHVVNAVLRGVLLRKDAGDIEAAWQEMYRATLPFGRKGLAIMAISGVDLALWDLKGKREGKSIVELLGGSREASVPAYKTVWSAEDAIRGATGRVSGHKGPSRFCAIGSAGARDAEGGRPRNGGHGGCLHEVGCRDDAPGG